MTDRSRRPFASDDRADSLLADILDETEEEARREEAELERSLDERERARQQAAEKAREAELAERRARLKKELERQAHLAEKRTQKMKALSTIEAPEAEAETAPEPARAEVVTPDPEELRREIREQVRREFQNTPMPAPAERPARRSKGAIFAIAAVLLAGIAGAAGFALTSSYEPDTNAYAKAVFAPMDRDAVAMEVGSTPLPKPEPAAKDEEPTRERVVRRGPRPERKTTPKKQPKETASAWGKPKQNEANKSLSNLQDALNNSDDPFTIDE